MIGKRFRLPMDRDPRRGAKTEFRNSALLVKIEGLRMERENGHDLKLSLRNLEAYH